MSGRRLVGVVALRDGEDESLTLERGLDRAQRSRAPGGDRRGEARKNDRPAKRQDGQRLALLPCRISKETGWLSHTDSDAGLEPLTTVAQTYRAR